MRQEWKEIAERNGIYLILDHLKEELGELSAVVDKCIASEGTWPPEKLESDWPITQHFDELVGEVADVQAMLDQLVWVGRLRKPVKAMMRYKAARQIWRLEDDGDQG